MKLKKGDEVAVTAGKDRGHRGKIEQVNIKTQSVLLLGVNVYKRHLKRRDEKNPGGIIDFPQPVPVGNVVLICPKCKKPTRVGFVVSSGEKHRICRKCKQMI